MTDTGYVPRLPEIREHLVRGIYIADVRYLLSLVDSLTAERDEAREQNRLATIDWANTAAELDAAEAEVKRLREALARVSTAPFAVGKQVARAALATPPSEGGES